MKQIESNKLLKVKQFLGIMIIFNDIPFFYHTIYISSFAYLYTSAIDWLIDWFTSVSARHGYMDGRSQIKVHTDERTQVYSAQSSLVVNHPSTNRAWRYSTSLTESLSKHWSPLRTSSLYICQHLKIYILVHYPDASIWKSDYIYLVDHTVIAFRTHHQNILNFTLVEKQLNALCTYFTRAKAQRILFRNRYMLVILRQVVV